MATFKETFIQAGRNSHVKPTSVTKGQFLKLCPDGVLPNGIRIADLSTADFNLFRFNTLQPQGEESDVLLHRMKQENKKVKEEAKEHVSILSLRQSIEDVMTNRVQKIDVQPYKITGQFDPEFEANVIISDPHFGSCIPGEVGLAPFGRKEESRRFAKIIQRVCEFRPDRRDKTKLSIHVLGDLIPNIIHEDSDGDLLIDQCCSVIYYLTRGIALCASVYPKVEVHCIVGNHDRWPNQKDRALHNKFDALGNVLYFGIKNGLMAVPNVRVFMYKSPFYIKESFGNKAFFTHGDTILDPGRPSQEIKVGALEKQILKIGQSIKGGCQLYATGHVHIPSATLMPTGAWFVTNGTIVPSDQYGQSLGLFYNECGQWLFTSTKSNIWEESMLIRTGAKDDADESLDELIKPYITFTES